MRAFLVGCFALLCFACLPACQSGAGEDKDKDDDKNKSFFERLADAQNPSRDRDEVDEEDWEEDRYERRRRRRDGWDEDNPYANLERQGPKLALKVTWEALARERALYERSEHRRPAGGVTPEMRIVLVSRSHPEARKAQFAQSEDERKGLVHTAVVNDRDLKRLVDGFRKRGFFDYAQPSSVQESMWSSSNARGRITIEEGVQGEGVTLLSLRGQGLRDNTKEIPALYSEGKRAIMLTRNRNASLNWTSVQRGDARVPAGR